jgi:hypothetical protein
VTLSRVTIKDIVDGPGPEAVKAIRDQDAASVLGFADIPAGQSRVTRDLTHLRPSEPGFTRVVEIAGSTPDGKIATGGFTLVAPKAALALNPDEMTPAPTEE